MDQRSGSLEDKLRRLAEGESNDPLHSMTSSSVLAEAAAGKLKPRKPVTPTHKPAGETAKAKPPVPPATKIAKPIHSAKPASTKPAAASASPAPRAAAPAPSTNKPKPASSGSPARAASPQMKKSVRPAAVPQVTPRPSSPTASAPRKASAPQPIDADGTSSLEGLVEEQSFDPAPSPRSSRRPVRAAANSDVKGMLTPIFFTLGMLLLIPGVWSVLYLTGLITMDRSSAGPMAWVMLAAWPISLTMFGFSWILFKQYNEAKKAQEAGLMQAKKRTRK